MKRNTTTAIYPNTKKMKRVHVSDLKTGKLQGSCLTIQDEEEALS